MNTATVITTAIEVIAIIGLAYVVDGIWNAALTCWKDVEHSLLPKAVEASSVVKDEVSVEELLTKNSPIEPEAFPEVVEIDETVEAPKPTKRTRTKSTTPKTAKEKVAKTPKKEGGKKTKTTKVEKPKAA